MKGKKLAIVVAVVLVAVVGGGVLALKLLINPEAYRAQITARIEESLHGRKVELGKLGLKLWPPLGISSQGLKVGGLGPDAEPLVTADSLVVRAALLPLLHKRLEIARVEIVGPRVWIEKLGPEKWSVSDLLAGSTAAGKEAKPAPATAPSSAPGLSVGSIVIRGGRFILADKTVAAKAPLEVAVEELSVKDALADKPAKVSLKMGPASNPGALQIDGEVGPLTGERVKEQLSADLRGTVKDLDLVELSAQLPAGIMPVQIQGGTLAGTFTARGKAREPIRATADLTIAGFSYTNSDKTWPVSKPQALGLNLAAVLDQAKDLLTIEPSTLAVANSKVDLGGTVAGISAQHLKINVQANGKALDLAALLDLIPGAGQGMSSGGVQAKGPVSFAVTVTSGSTMNVDAEADLTAASVNVPGSFTKPAGVSARLKSLVILGKEKIDLDKTSLALGALNLAGGGSIKRDKNLTTNINLQSGPADTDQVLSLFPALDAYRLGGQMKLGLGIAGALKQKESLAVKITNLVQKSDKASFNLDALARLTNPVQVNFSLKGDQVNLDQIMADPAPAKAGPKADDPDPPDDQGKTKKSSGSASGVVVNGDITANKVLYSGLDLTGLATKLSLKNGKLDLPEFKANVLGGSVSGPMNFNLAQAPLSGQVNLNLGGFVMQELIKRFTSYPQVINGTAKGRLNLDFAGTSVKAISKTVGGNGTVDIQDGSVKGLDLVNGLLEQWAGSDAVKKVALQSLAPSIKRSIGDKTDFKEINASLDLATGNINLKKAVMEIAEGRAVFNGKIGFDSSLDLTGEIQFNPAITNQVMAPARSWIEKQSGGAVSGNILDLLLVDGRLVLPFAVKGAWPKPGLALDGAAYSRTVNQNLKSQPPEKVIENLVGEKGKKQIEDQTKKAQEELKKKAGEIGGEEAQKFLDGLMPK